MKGSRAVLLAMAGLGAAAPMWLASGRARAQEPPRVELLWTADPSCPSGDAVVAAVDALVRGSPAKDLIVARAEVTHPGSWRLLLETRAGARVGKRTVAADTCEQLADATALILALMIDPSAALKRPEPIAPLPRVEPPPVAAPPTAPALPAASPVPEPVTPLPAAPSRGPLPELAVAVTAVADVGTLPGPALGVGAGGGLLVGPYRFNTDITYFPTRTGRLATLPAAGGEFTLVAAALVACRSMVTAWRASAGLCLGAELDVVLAKGFGVTFPESGSARWGALLGGGLVDVPLAGPLAAELRVMGVIPFARPPFFFDDIGTIYRPTVVGLRLGLGLTAHF